MVVAPLVPPTPLPTPSPFNRLPIKGGNGKVKGGKSCGGFSFEHQCSICGRRRRADIIVATGLEFSAYLAVEIVGNVRCISNVESDQPVSAIKC